MTQIFALTQPFILVLLSAIQNKISLIVFNMNGFSEMDIFQYNQTERQAIQCLLQLENSVQQVQDWKQVNQSNWKNRQLKQDFNFTQIHRKINPELKQSQNMMKNSNLINVNRFRRARSLFDPMKIFKIVSQQSMIDQPLIQQPIQNSAKKRIIHRLPEKFRDLNFAPGHPSNNLAKRDQVCPHNSKNNSSQFLNGESVIIQVQSYEQNLKIKQIQHQKSKTLRSRDNKSQLNQENVQNFPPVTMFQIKSQVMKLKRAFTDQMHPINKQVNKITSRMRFTSYLNKKVSQRDGDTRKYEQHSSLDLYNCSNKDQISTSLRKLLNNLKQKHFNQSKDVNKPPISQKYYQSPKTKVFDKDAIFKNYEQQQLNRVKRNKIHRGQRQVDLSQDISNSLSKYQELIIEIIQYYIEYSQVLPKSLEDQGIKTPYVLQKDRYEKC